MAMSTFVKWNIARSPKLTELSDMLSRLLVAGLVSAIVATAIIGVAAQAPSRGGEAIEITGPVRVIEGDTVDVYVAGSRVLIGLIGIKAPRGNTRCGVDSANFLRNLMQSAGRLSLSEDPNYQFDSRKRRMYYLTLGRNRSAAVEMVRAGMATQDGTGKEADEIAAAAASWSTTTGCPPLGGLP